MRKILIVDDNSINRSLLSNVLSSEYEIIEAENGLTALESIYRNRDTLSAVLMDIVMPIMDGYEALCRIRNDPDLIRIPVIIVTGSADEASRTKTLTLGANDFIVKPFSPDIIRHCLKNNIALCETASKVIALQTDRLTGLYTREVFFDKAAALIDAQKPGYYVMACFDVDNFKIVNDQRGSGKGDEALRHIAETFKIGFEPEGGICCRIAGDNFAVLYPKRMLETEKLAVIRRDAAAWDGSSLPVSFSIGRYIVEDLSLSVSAMYDRASLAEEAAKGKYDGNIVLYNESMRDELLREQRIVTEMKTALETGQFEVWFQPQYNHASGALVGAEALVRWRQPDSGALMPPNDFIPVFERNGFIYELDKFVWEQVCRFLRRWTDEGRNPLPVSVNVSRHDMFREDFYEVITGLTRRYGIPVSQLRLEITETAFSKAAQQLIGMVKRLIEYGFTVEIDDFGSGYSSLNTLKDVPAQIIKLDMRFLESSGDSRRGGSILESIVRMAKWLGMAVIAEGVETRAQADYLKSIGCNYVQGFLYARPMPVSEYEALAKGHGKEEKLIVLETVQSLDNSAFWDPESMDTLIFNSYIGGACIFEYHNNRSELLRVNDNYIRELCIRFEADEPLSVLDLYQYMDNKGQRVADAAVNEAVSSGRECTAEVRLSAFKGRFENAQYIRFSLRVIARAGEHFLLYCVIANITEQRRAERKERESSRALEQMIQDMPGGYARAKLLPDGRRRPVYFNDKLCKMLGMDRPEMMALYGENSMLSVHPDDVLSVTRAVERMVETDEAYSYRYRLKNGGGGYTWVSVFGRITRDEKGDSFLNLYYTDATEQMKEEETQKALLDNLPCGVGVYEFRDGQLNLTYQNRNYWELIGMGETPLPDSVPLSAIHPDDIPSVMEQLFSAIEESRDISCDIRLRHLTRGYLPVHLNGRIARGASGAPLIYATFTPISGESLSYREMVPIVLSAIMESTGNLSFVKDKDLRYMIASKTFAAMVGAADEKQLVGKTDYDIFDRELADKYRHDDEQLLESRRSIVDMIETIPSPDGTCQYSSTSKYLLYDAQENIIGLYGTGRNITEQIRLEQTQREAAEQLQFLNDTAHSLLAQADIETGINGALRNLMEFFSGSRAYIFEFDYELSIAKNTYEVCADGVAPMRDILSEVPLSVMDFWFEAFAHQKYYSITDVSTLGESRVSERELLMEQSISSLFAVPLYRDGKLFGMLGVDDPRRQMTQLDRLLALGDYIAVMLTRRDYEHRLAAGAKAHEQMMQDMPGGYAKMRITDSGVVPVFLNDEFCRLCGMTHEQAMQLYADNAYAGVHPEDMEYANSVISEAIANRTTLSLRIRLANNCGGYTPMQVFYRVTEDRDGLYLNGYYSDATELNEAERQRRELLENLPCGAGIYEITDGSIRATYLNKQYRAYLKRDINDLSTAPVFEVVHPDDTPKLYAALQQALSGDKEGSCDIRIMDGVGGYIPFHVVGRIMERSRNKTAIYVTYVPITESELLLHRRAETDGMTGVYNKATVESLIRERLSQARGCPCAMFIVDVDNLKTINDSIGHPQGDRAICRIADALKLQFRKSDIVGRIGGDEFVVFLEGMMNHRMLSRIASKLLQRMSEIHVGEADDYQIHVSVGVAAASEATSFSELYRQADKALYNAKRSGKNRFAFFE